MSGDPRRLQRVGAHTPPGRDRPPRHGPHLVGELRHRQGVDRRRSGRSPSPAPATSSPRSPCSLILWRRQGSVRPPAGQLAALVGLGLLGFGAYQVLWTTGLTQISAGDSALLLAASPVLVALLAAAVGMDRLSAPEARRGPARVRGRRRRDRRLAGPVARIVAGRRRADPRRRRPVGGVHGGREPGGPADRPAPGDDLDGDRRDVPAGAARRRGGRRAAARRASPRQRCSRSSTRARSPPASPTCS